MRRSGYHGYVIGTGHSQGAGKRRAYHTDIDIIEASEAFAVQFLAVGKELGFDKEKSKFLRRRGALDHSIGASGAHILVTLFHAMEKRGAKRDLAVLCIGGGQGVAIIVEKLSF